MKKIKIFDNNFGNNSGTSPHIITDIWKEWKSIGEEDADVHVYVDRLFSTSDLKNNKINCAWIVEPPIVNGENYTNAIKNYKKFKYVFSFLKNLESKIDNFVFIPFGTTHLRQEDFSLHTKTKLISTIFSDKQWNNYHRLRHQIFNEFKNFNIDFYGSGTGSQLPYKIPALQDYMFSIVVENSEEQDYFSEKIIDCFLTGTIPIYLGCPAIDDYFNSKGIIKFKSLEELNNIINSNISDTVYSNSLDAIKENFNLALNYIHPEYFIFNKIKDL